MPDLARSFTYMFEDKAWLSKVLVGAAFVLLSPLIIGALFLGGYMVEVIKRSYEDNEVPLPEWDNFGDLVSKGYKLVATRGTAKVIKADGVECAVVNKVMEGRPHIVDMIKNGQIDLIVNTTEGKQAIADSYTIRRTALQNKVSYSTTLAGARATCMALEYLTNASVNSLQDLHQEQST